MENTGERLTYSEQRTLLTLDQLQLTALDKDYSYLDYQEGAYNPRVSVFEKNPKLRAMV